MTERTQTKAVIGAFTVFVIEAILIVGILLSGCTAPQSEPVETSTGTYRVKDLLWSEEIWWATFHGGSGLEYGASFADCIVGMGIDPHSQAMQLLDRSDLEAQRDKMGAMSEFEPQYNPPWQWCFDWVEGKTNEGYL